MQVAKSVYITLQKLQIRKCFEFFNLISFGTLTTNRERDLGVSDIRNVNKFLIKDDVL